jgi:hypothetical protein
MVLILEVPLAGIALVLSLLSWRTMRTIKHIDVGKSFWIPVLTSGLFFLVGSFLTILGDLGFSFAYSAEIASLSRLLALCILLAGVYTYSRRITKNLAEKYMLSPGAVVADSQEEIEASDSVVERVVEKKDVEEIECKHDFGYLKSLPRGAQIPDECLNCLRIVECKHSYLAKPDGESELSISLSERVISDVSEEEGSAPNA